MKKSILALMALCSATYAGDYTVSKVGHPIIKQRVVEFDARYFVGDDGYFSTAENIRTQRIAEQYVTIEDRLIDLQSQIESINSFIKNINTTPKVDNTPKVDDKEEPKQDVPSNIDPKELGTEVDANVAKIFKDSCVACHGNESSFALFGDDEKGEYLRNLPLATRTEIYNRVLGADLDIQEKARMPKGAPPLSDEEVSSLRLWMIQKANQERGN